MTVPDERLDEISRDWREDSFVMALAGQERLRRAKPGYVAVTRSGGAFWMVKETGSPADFGSMPFPQPGTGAVRQLGVVLPLSGQYSALGLSTRNGIELAVQILSAGSQESRPKVEVRDDGGDALKAVVAAKELIALGAPAILGPLMADPARQVSDIVRQSGRTMISFSKSSDFPVGSGVFRLGVTVQSQVDSVVEMVQKQMGLTRFAVVFPADSAGEEYACSLLCV